MTAKFSYIEKELEISKYKVESQRKDHDNYFPIVRLQ